MLLKSKEVEVVPDNPFQNDELKRMESAKVLTEFVLSTKEPLVICIDAPWGQGKTTFLRMWEQHLKNHSVPTLYFNAWENDFSDDALVCLIGEISSSIKELSKHGDPSKVQEYLDKAKNFGVALFKSAAPSAIKIFTAGMVDLDKPTEQTLADYAAAFAKEKIEKYENSKKSIKNFKEELSNLASSASDENDPKPLVFIIDELDRCRPNFAIEILEKAKHLFNVNNIVFVLGADKEQLGHSIKSIYGADLNVNGYLRRFIDFDYLLPPPEKGLFVKALFKKYSFSDYFSQKKSFESLRYEQDHFLTMFEELFELYDLTLREQEHCCSLLSLAIRTTPENQALHPFLLGFLIVLKIKKPDFYKSTISGKFNSNEVLEHFKALPEAENFLNNHNYGAIFEAYIVIFNLKSNRDFNPIYFDYENKSKLLDLPDKEKIRASKIARFISDLYDEAGYLKSYLVNKIEIASRFKS